MLKKFLKCERGATAIEYTLIAAAMSVLLITSFPLLTGAISTALGKIASSINNI